MIKARNFVFCNTNALKDFLESFASRNEIYSHKGYINDVEFHNIYPEHRIIVKKDRQDSYILFYTVSSGGYSEVSKGVHFAKIQIIDNEKVLIDVSLKGYVRLINLVSIIFMLVLIVKLIIEDDFAYILFATLIIVGLFVNKIYKSKFTREITDLIKTFQ